MAHSHSPVHSVPDDDVPLRGTIRIAVVVIAIATLVGLVVLWPRGDAPDLAGTTRGIDYVEATVTGVEVVDCADPLEGLPTQCQAVAIDVSSGPTEGDSAVFLSSLADFSAPDFARGDDVVLAYNELAPAGFQYVFLEFQRGTPLLALALVFVVVVVAFGRWKGFRALLGLGLSLAVIVGFLLPSLLRDNNALAVALVTTSVVAFTALYLAHGVSRSTSIALLGTLASVTVIALGAVFLTEVAELSGLSDESFQILRVTAQAVEPRGILIAGIVIGALGVLDDVTVTQVSAVTELRRANPALSRKNLYRGAIRIGRDHVASTVNTLVLAYVGAALALMLFFLQEGRSITQVLNREIVAIEAVRILVGSIGLILSVPLTTALAVAVASPRSEQSAEPEPAGPVPSSPSWDDFGPVDGT